ncbi:hypothetical protein HanXRQr2_Chr16g0744071 [Helianthus annuus]|uniref:Uncharacterized protein n=1 Tax=Helianthus annuus TaxID=4232 RepID=A0A9K3GXW1_HELAN|nr:hypothetical protein HanXRQr2_Chr16g0744071 [Helianthus annuus]KAJ0820893.1 hypothetical protein HanPSC8_Chr16g0713451 [Helianthus annuus]
MKNTSELLVGQEIIFQESCQRTSRAEKKDLSSLNCAQYKAIDARVLTDIICTHNHYHKKQLIYI